MQSQLEIHDQTLQNISYEIHDNIGQVASLIKINLNTLKLDNIEKATIKINDTKDLVRQLISDVKSLSASLGTDRIAKIGLIKAIEIEVERLNKTEQFVTKIIKEDDLPLLNNEKAILLYRMTQEILNNIVKHAQAKHITVLITNTANRFILAIKDNGIGFDVAEKLNTKDGAGLSNLRNRAKLVNASVDIESTVDKGTKITIEMPI
jgi:two-component system, NarL family, sensor kinase